MTGDDDLAIFERVKISAVMVAFGWIVGRFFPAWAGAYVFVFVIVVPIVAHYWGDE